MFYNGNGFGQTGILMATAPVRVEGAGSAVQKVTILGTKATASPNRFLFYT